MHFVKNFLIAFFAQIVFIVLMVIVVEMLGLRFFHLILFVLYIFPIERIISLFKVNQEPVSATLTVLASLVPLATYSAIYSLIRCQRLRVKNRSELK